MTTDSRAGAVLGAEILSACDRILGEVGRRQHMFGWLRLPDAPADEWLAVDAYYPGNRVVVACSGQHDALLSELVPAHGLRLLLVDPEDPAAVRPRLAELPAVKRPVDEPSSERAVPRGSAVAQAFSSALAPGHGGDGLAERSVSRGGGGAWGSVSRGPGGDGAAERSVSRGGSGAAERSVSRGPGGDGAAERSVSRGGSGAAERSPRARGPAAADPFPPEGIVAAGVLVGVLVVAVLCGEIYLGVTQVLGAGHLLLAFGVALDASARVLGTVAASRVGHRSWILPCVLVGSPAVAMFALFQKTGPVGTDPAPLAGLLSLGAMAVIALALLGTVLGV